jgi:uncharacterized DUF497 family protein
VHANHPGPEARIHCNRPFDERGVLLGVGQGLRGRPDSIHQCDDKRHTTSYHSVMEPFRWNPEKNEALKADRGVSFELVVVAIGAGGLLDILTHPNQEKYPRQRILVVTADDYAYLVPFVEDEDCFFLKTIIPSRKATRDYLQEGEPDAED